MKILFICPQYYPNIGGVETHVQEIAERLAKAHIVEVLCADGLTLTTHNGIKITRFNPIGSSKNFHLSLGLLHYIKTHNFDIVHAHNIHSFPAYFASFTPNRFFITPHYNGASQSLIRSALHIPYRKLTQTIFQKAEKIICVSNYEKSQISRDFGFSEKTIIIPNGITIPDNLFSITLPKTIIYVGRIEKYKGIQHIISALPSLPDYQLLIIGKGDYTQSLITLSKALGVFDRITYIHDFIPKNLLLSYIKASYCLINLSKLEAYGLTVAESLSVGTPCIVSNGTALSEFIDNNLCFGIDNPSELIDIIPSLKHDTPIILPTWDDVAKKTELLY